MKLGHDPLGRLNASRSSSTLSPPRNFEEWALIALLALGALLRIRQFVFNRSLWLDEAYLATSFVDRDTWALLTEPLANGQAAPLGFLLAAKAAFVSLGGTDWALRVVPLLAGLATLFVGWKVALLAFRSAWARLLFVGLLAFSPVSIYYASEFKQYGSDMLIALMIVWAVLAFRGDEWRPASVRLALVGMLGVWFSHPSVFLLASGGVILGVESLRARQWRALTGLTLVGAVWVASFALHYAVAMKGMAANPALKRFWEMAYAPLPPWSADAAEWYWENSLGLVFLAFRHSGIAHHLPLPGWTDSVSVVLGLAVLAGWASSWFEWRRLWAMVGLPVVLTLLASALHLYPFRSRLILFLVPLLWLALAALVELGATASKAKRGQNERRSLQVARRVAPLAVGVFLAVFSITAWQRSAAPYNSAAIKGAMAYIQERMAPGDQLMISTWSEKAFAFYSGSFGLEQVALYAFRKTRNLHHDAYATVRRICRAGEHGRTWLLLSHRFEERHAFLAELQQLSPIVDQYESNGAGAYLFQFSDSPYCTRYRPATSN